MSELKVTESLDLREQIIRIDHMMADMQRMSAERDRIDADIRRSYAEQRLVEINQIGARQQIIWQPIVVLISGLTAGAALIVAGAALMKLFG